MVEEVAGAFVSVAAAGLGVGSDDGELVTVDPDNAGTGTLVTTTVFVTVTKIGYINRNRLGCGNHIRGSDNVCRSHNRRYWR